jgi:hypothetical protein
MRLNIALRSENQRIAELRQENSVPDRCWCCCLEGKAHEGVNQANSSDERSEIHDERTKDPRPTVEGHPFWILEGSRPSIMLSSHPQLHCARISCGCTDGDCLLTKDRAKMGCNCERTVNDSTTSKMKTYTKSQFSN